MSHSPRPATLTRHQFSDVLWTVLVLVLVLGALTVLAVATSVVAVPVCAAGLALVTAGMLRATR